MITDSLLGQQVIGWKFIEDKKTKVKKPVLDEDVLSILKMMYPDFRLVKSMFEIYPDDSFIYIGDPNYINSVKNKPNPHIIVATSGIDLLDKKVLLEYVYGFKGKSVPKYFEDKNFLKFWSDSEFYYNLKFILLLGKVQDEEVDKASLFLKIIENISNPHIMIKEYLNFLSTSDDSVRYIDSGLVTYINNALTVADDFNTKSNAEIIGKRAFVQSYGELIPKAVNNLLDSKVDLDELRLFNFIRDLTRKDGRKK